MISSLREYCLLFKIGEMVLLCCIFSNQIFSLPPKCLLFCVFVCERACWPVFCFSFLCYFGYPLDKRAYDTSSGTRKHNDGTVHEYARTLFPTIISRGESEQRAAAEIRYENKGPASPFLNPPGPLSPHGIRCACRRQIPFDLILRVDSVEVGACGSTRLEPSARGPFARAHTYTQKAAAKPAPPRPFSVRIAQLFN